MEFWSDRFHPNRIFTPHGRASTGLNRPAIDIKGAYTFLDLQTGAEISGALGLTFNARNRATKYQSGEELHFEWALNQHFPFGLAAGIGGYFYQQVTKDYGSGDTIGSNIGRSVAIGPLLSYALTADTQEVDISGRWYHEFAVINGHRGDVIYATLSFRM
ncbi:MAG TPA: transporter [Methylocella sp.]|nr:transporter [Methylocella sp.]